MADGDIARYPPRLHALGSSWVRFLGRALLLVWAGFWVYFGVLSGVSERLPLGAVILHGAVPGALFLALAAVAWRWERLGSWVLIGGSLAGFAYVAAFTGIPAPHNVTIAISFAFPSMLGGWLLLIATTRVAAPGPVLALALGLGVTLLASSLLLLPVVVVGTTWGYSPWGPVARSTGEWLPLVGVNLVLCALLVAGLYREARMCLARSRS